MVKNGGTNGRTSTRSVFLDNPPSDRMGATFIQGHKAHLRSGVFPLHDLLAPRPTWHRNRCIRVWSLAHWCRAGTLLRHHGRGNNSALPRDATAEVVKRFANTRTDREP